MATCSARGPRAGVVAFAAALLVACGGDPPGSDAGVDAGPPPTPVERLRAASSGPAEVVVVDDAARVVRGTFPTGGGSPEAAARGLIEAHGEVFGVDDRSDLALREVRSDDLSTVVIFDRVEGDLPVFGAELRVAIGGAAITWVGARLPGSLDIAATPSRTEAQARDDAVAGLAAEGAAPMVASAATLGVFDPRVLLDRAGAAALAWRVELVDGDERSWVAWVDDATGALLMGTSATVAARERVVAACREDALGYGDCVARSHDVITTEAGPVDPPPAGVDPATLALGAAIHASLGVAYDYYQSTFARDGWDGDGAPVRAFIRYGDRNAYWMGNHTIQVRDADYASPDILVHELSHAVVEDESRLVSWGEPGALGEALADVFSCFANGRWELRYASGGLVRDLSQTVRPVAQHYPDDMRWPPAGQRVQESYDSGYVHANSAIESLALYLLVDGGPNPDRVGEASVPAIGQAEAEQILYRAVRMYLVAQASFLDFRFAALRACEDLVGRGELTLEHCGALLEAHGAVGVGAWDHDYDTWGDDCRGVTAAGCFEVDNCPDLFNPSQADADGDGVGDACEATPGDAGVDAGADAGVSCDGPSLVCPPTYASSDGVARELRPSPRLCFQQHSTSRWWRASCQYFPPGSSTDGVEFGAYYHDSRRELGGCLVDEEGRDPDYPTYLFPSPTSRSWVAYVGPDRDTEDAARRPLANGLLAQTEVLAAPCEPIECPASFTDATGTYTYDSASLWRQIPEVIYTASAWRSFAACWYQPGDLGFLAYWAQESDESLLCMPAGTGRVRDGVVQAEVQFPFTRDPAIDDIRSAVATQIYDQIRPRALACD